MSLPELLRFCRPDISCAEIAWLGRKLDIARHESQVEPQFGVIRQLSEHIERFDIFGREPPRFGEPFRHADMERGIQHRCVAVMLVEHARFVEASLPLRFIAKRINREHTVLPLQQVGSAFRHDIVHRPSN
jgi:hypothetical protein